MGRSNGCEANRKREENAKRSAKFAKEGNSQIAKNASAMNLVCQKCFQAFMCTQKKMCVEHAANKHSKDKLEDCFPGMEL